MNQSGKIKLWIVFIGLMTTFLLSVFISSKLSAQVDPSQPSTKALQLTQVALQKTQVAQGGGGGTPLPTATPTPTPVIVNASGIATPGVMLVLNNGTAAKIQQLISYNGVIVNTNATTLLANIYGDSSPNTLLGIVPLPPGLTNFNFANDILHNLPSAAGATVGFTLISTPGPSSAVSVYSNGQIILK